MLRRGHGGGYGGWHGLIGALSQLATIGQERMLHRQGGQGFRLPGHVTAQVDKSSMPLASAMSTALPPRRPSDVEKHRLLLGIPVYAQSSPTMPAGREGSRGYRI